MQRDFNQEHLDLPNRSKRNLSFFEFWPSWLFYLPIKIYAALLMIRYRSFLLPTVANPYLAGGAFCGDAKSEILEQIEQYLPEYAAPFFLFDRQAFQGSRSVRSELEEIEKRCIEKGINLPYVAKPQFGCRGAGVCLIKSNLDMERYLTEYPPDEQFVVHALIPYAHEAGVFYCRLPGQDNGQIISLTLKYFPKLIGDGKKTIGQLIKSDPRASQIQQIYLSRHAVVLNQVLAKDAIFPLVFAGNHSKGTIFKDGAHLITEELQQTFDKISKKLPEFYFGRYDVRFSTFEDLELGKQMKIVEINGASAESTHIWDSDCGLLKAYCDIFRQFNYLFRISLHNKQRGFKPQTWKVFHDSYKRDQRLSAIYPGTH
jgi:hypothetical protein